MEPFAPGLILDDVYRVLGDREAAGAVLEVARIEPAPGITRLHYRLLDGARRPLRDASGQPLMLVGGTDDPPAGIRPGSAFAIPGRGEVGSAI